jgi:predicted HTH transcriptional regulator
MISKRLEEIVENDLLGLVGVPETRQLEFKENIVGNADDEIKEFLKDVSAMANAVGGDIVYGIAEAADQNGNTTATAVNIE